MVGRWGVHPVLEAGLDVLAEVVGEDEVPREIEDALPRRGRLSTRALVEVAGVCLEHVRPRVSRRQATDFERIAALVARQAAAPAEHAGPLEAWHRDLDHTRRDAEHGRGAVRVAGLAGQVAWCDVMRAAPGVGPEAVAYAEETVREAARLLAKDRPALVALVLALAQRIAARQAS